MRIAQISDIHWRGIQRHEEYTKAFKLLFNQLKEQSVDLIVCTGDIFHTKTQGITPEVIDKMVWMFNGLAAIAPLHMILGNHDGNLSNEDRQDAISPIVEAISNPRIFFYKKSDTYRVPQTNLHFGVFSCFDKDGWSRVKPSNTDKAINVAMFHGSVTGCETDGLWRIRDGESTVNMFTGWDFAMLGDIHKAQFLARRIHAGPTRDLKPWMGYPGSLIQQNYGEDELKGYFIWDIKGNDLWDVKFCELKNMAPFITVPWAKTVAGTVKQLAKRDIKCARIRVASHEPISRLEIKQLQQLLCEGRGASEVIPKIDSANKLSTLDTLEVSVRKASLRNNADALKLLYREYIKANPEKFPFSPEQVEKAEELVVGYLAKLGQTEQDSSARDIVWSIKGLEFSNLYRYGESNRIDFQKLSGIVGIFGPNKVGKSSVVGSLMYGLYNTTDRGPIKSAYIINKTKMHARCKVHINVGGKDYLVVRQVEKSLAKRKGLVDEEKAATTLNLFRLDCESGALIEENSTNENGETRSDTDKVIRNLIGTSNDFLLTAFSNQGGINKFIEEGATERKAILNRFLDFDVFERLYKIANDDRTAINSKTLRFDPTIWEATLLQTRKRQNEKKQKTTELQQEIAKLREEIDQQKTWLKDHESSDLADIILQHKVATTELEAARVQLAKVRARNTKLVGEITSSELAYAVLLDELAEIDPKILEEKKEALKVLRNSFVKSETKTEKEKHKLDSQKKNVRKLDLVPCGDTFPSCHYIKDAHEDKKVLEDQKVLVESLLSASKKLKEELLLLEREQLDKKLQDYTMKVERVASLSKSNDALKRELALSTESEKTTADSIPLKEQNISRLHTKIEMLEGEEYASRLSLFQGNTKQLSSSEAKLSQLFMEMGADKNKLLQLEQEKEEAYKLNGELKIVDSVAQGFSKSGIPAIVLKTQLPAINSELEKILTGIVDFRLSLETEVNSNSLEVYIEDAHSRRVIELASGMEKMISSLAIRVALINLSSLPKPDIFIIDEGFGTLDEEGLQKCMQLLTLLKSYFKTVLVISHIPQIKEVADRIIEIKNDGQESSVQV